MPDLPRSAVVIPFPPPRPRARAKPAADPAAERLARAVAELQAALAAQARSVAIWRAALGALGDETRAVGGNLARYQTGLDRLQQRVAVLRGTVRTLDARLAGPAG